MLLLWQCKHGAHSRMADKLSKGSNSSTFKIVKWYGVIRDAGKSYGNTKNCNTENNTPPPTHTQRPPSSPQQTHTHTHKKKKKKKIQKKKTKQKKKKNYHIIFEKKKKSSTLIWQKCKYGICLPPKIDTLSEQRASHNMSKIHTAWSLFCQILTGQCTTVLTNQKAKTQKRD